MKSYLLGLSLISLLAGCTTNNSIREPAQAMDSDQLLLAAVFENAAEPVREILTSDEFNTIKFRRVTCLAADKTYFQSLASTIYQRRHRTQRLVDSRMVCHFSPDGDPRLINVTFPK